MAVLTDGELEYLRCQGTGRLATLTPGRNLQNRPNVWLRLPLSELALISPPRTSTISPWGKSLSIIGRPEFGRRALTFLERQGKNGRDRSPQTHSVRLGVSAGRQTARLSRCQK
jgi:hypothetical protein